MRQLIRTYTITGQHEITITGYDFTNQDVRLIINETKASSAQTDQDLINSVLVSSTKKANIVSVVNGVITLASTTANLTVGDELTIEIDIDNVAKTSDIPTVQQIQNGLAKTSELPSDYAKPSDIPTVNQIQSGLATSNDVTTVSNKIGTFTGQNTVASKLSDIQTSIEGVSVSDLKLQQFFGIEGTFEAEAVGGETTDNPVINECKARYAEVFEDLLPSDFVMPNSVTIDDTTYTGTVS